MQLGGSDIYAIVVPCISAVYLLIRCALVMKPNKLTPNIRFGLSIVIAVLWLVVAPLATFVGPFTEVGNGYIAAWGGLAAAIGLCTEEYTAKVKADNVEQRG